MRIEMFDLRMEPLEPDLSEGRQQAAAGWSACLPVRLQRRPPVPARLAGWPAERQESASKLLASGPAD